MKFNSLGSNWISRNRGYSLSEGRTDFPLNKSDVIYQIYKDDTFSDDRTENTLEEELKGAGYTTLAQFNSNVYIGQEIYVWKIKRYIRIISLDYSNENKPCLPSSIIGTTSPAPGEPLRSCFEYVLKSDIITEDEYFNFFKPESGKTRAEREAYYNNYIHFFRSTNQTPERFKYTMTTPSQFELLIENEFNISEEVAKEKINSGEFNVSELPQEPNSESQKFIIVQIEENKKRYYYREPWDELDYNEQIIENGIRDNGINDIIGGIYNGYKFKFGSSEIDGKSEYVIEFNDGTSTILPQGENKLLEVISYIITTASVGDVIVNPGSFQGVSGTFSSPEFVERLSNGTYQVVEANKPGYEDELSISSNGQETVDGKTINKATLSVGPNQVLTSDRYIRFTFTINDNQAGILGEKVRKIILTQPCYYVIDPISNILNLPALGNPNTKTVYSTANVENIVFETSENSLINGEISVNLPTPVEGQSNKLIRNFSFTTTTNTDIQGRSININYYGDPGPTNKQQFIISQKGAVYSNRVWIGNDSETTKTPSTSIQKTVDAGEINLSYQIYKDSTISPNYQIIKLESVDNWINFEGIDQDASDKSLITNNLVISENCDESSRSNIIYVKNQYDSTGKTNSSYSTIELTQNKNTYGLQSNNSVKFGFDEGVNNSQDMSNSLLITKTSSGTNYLYNINVQQSSNSLYSVTRKTDDTRSSETVRYEIISKPNYNPTDYSETLSFSAQYQQNDNTLSTRKIYKTVTVTTKAIDYGIDCNDSTSLSFSCNGGDLDRTISRSCSLTSGYQSLNGIGDNKISLSFDSNNTHTSEQSNVKVTFTAVDNRDEKDVRGTITINSYQRNNVLGQNDIQLLGNDDSKTFNYTISECTYKASVTPKNTILATDETAQLEILFYTKSRSIISSLVLTPPSGLSFDENQISATRVSDEPDTDGFYVYKATATANFSLNTDSSREFSFSVAGKYSDDSSKSYGKKTLKITQAGVVDPDYYYIGALISDRRRIDSSQVQEFMTNFFNRPADKVCSNVNKVLSTTGPNYSAFQIVDISLWTDKTNTMYPTGLLLFKVEYDRINSPKLSTNEVKVPYQIDIEALQHFLSDNGLDLHEYFPYKEDVYDEDIDTTDTVESLSNQLLTIFYMTYNCKAKHYNSITQSIADFGNPQGGVVISVEGTISYGGVEYNLAAEGGERAHQLFVDYEENVDGYTIVFIK